ncbi:MAG: hypothetical protein ACPHRO_03915 [Nannocystaceae bacterium]
MKISRTMTMAFGVTTLLLTVGCNKGNDGESDGASSSSGITTLGDSASDGETDAGDSIGDNGDGPVLDVASADDGDDSMSTEGCRGVDFLFVIDNSGSMEDEQSNLLASFPGFVQSMQAALEDNAQSFRIMVVDTDGIGAACIPICDMFGETGYCNGISCAGDVCDVRVGGGNNVNRATDMSCGLPGGKRYADSDEVNIPDAFDCIGRVGTSGSGIELVADSMLTALSDDYVGAGGCNEGFLRDDAVLVVTIITDEDDAGDDMYFTSPGDPSSWYNQLAGLKDYNPAAIVMLGLLGDTEEEGGLCEPYDEGTGDGAQQATRLREFVQNFDTKGLLGSVCAPNYNSFFDQAVELIDTTCDEFDPVG